MPFPAAGCCIAALVAMPTPPEPLSALSDCRQCRGSFGRCLGVSDFARWAAAASSRVPVPAPIRRSPHAGLSEFKVSRVSRAACARHAQRLGLGPHLVLQPNFRRLDGQTGPEDSMLAEAFEAVLGAMYEVWLRRSLWC